jgi:hypothetical protein
MNTHNQQIIRIHAKLLKAKAADPNLKTFGAGKHKYILGKPCTAEQVTAFETKYGITLPDCYEAFVLNVGNGGASYLNAGAGPYYGIYALGTNADDFAVEEYLRAPCVLYPDMKKSSWDELISRTQDANENEITEAEYDQEIGKIFGGLLPIVCQGCTYFSGLVLNGPHRGRVVNLDIDRQMPSFTYENNFLDWYERWLDEVISGQLMGGGASWFGYKPPQ